MAAQKIGWVKTGRSRRSYEVKWEPGRGDVYVSWGGWTWCGRASSASHAMRRGEAWLHDK